MKKNQFLVVVLYWLGISVLSGQQSFVFYDYTIAPLPIVKPNSCNMVSYGDLELTYNQYRNLTTTLYNTSNFPNKGFFKKLDISHQTPAYFLDTFLMYQASYTAGICNSNSSVLSQLYCVNASSNFINCPSKILPNPFLSNNKSYGGLTGIGNSNVNQSEAITFKLNRKINRDSCLYKFKMNVNVEGCQNQILIYGSAEPPCVNPVVTNFPNNYGLGVTTNCSNNISTTQFLIGNVLVSQPYWNNYSTTINPIAMSNFPLNGIEYITIVGLTNNYSFQNFIDNIELYNECDNNVKIDLYSDETVCVKDTQVVNCQVSLNSMSSSTNQIVKLKAMLPIGFSMVGGNFNNTNNEYILNLSSLANNQKLDLQMLYVLNQQNLDEDSTYKISVETIDSGKCINYSKEIPIKIIFDKINVTKIVSNLNPNIGDTVEVKYKICNSSKKVGENILIKDSIPDYVEILPISNLPIVGNKLSFNWTIMQSDSNNIVCDTIYGYKMIFKTNCKLSSSFSFVSGCKQYDSILTFNSSKSSYSFELLKQSNYICQNDSLKIMMSINPKQSQGVYKWNKVNFLPIIRNIKDSIIWIKDSGVYEFEVNNQNCSLYKKLSLFKADSLKILDSILNPTCIKNGKIYVNVVNGENPYSYTWSNGTNLSNNIGLGSGLYSLTLTDSRNCKLIKSYFLDSSKFAIIVDAKVKPSYCNSSNGSISLIPSGGIQPYIYAWNDGVSTQNRVGLLSGNYLVTVTDANGCKSTKSIFVNSLSYSLNVSEIIINPVCFSSNGSISLTTNGGTSPYLYKWNNNLGTSSYLNSIKSGLYVVTVTDNNGCTKVNTYNLLASTKNDISLELIPEYICNSNFAKITSNIKNGVEPYSYLWSNGATTSSISNVSFINSPNVSLTITDANGCSKISSVQLKDYIDVGTGTNYPTYTSAIGVGKPFKNNSFDNRNLRIKVHGSFYVDSLFQIGNSEFNCLPGSRIVVENRPGYLILNKCELKTCTDSLWKGIEVDGIIDIDSTSIYDAQYAVLINNKEFHNIKNSVFKNNYVGVCFPPLRSFNYVLGSIFPSTIFGNLFEGSGGSYIKKAFFGMKTDSSYSLQYPTLEFANKSWAGVIASNLELIRLSNNKFLNLNNGIIFNNCNMPQSYNNYFESIIGINNPKLINYPNGVGVFGNCTNFSTRSLSWLMVLGNGKNSLTPSFKNCDVAVKTINFRDQHLSYNKMINVGIGFEGIFARRCVILSNSISARQKGIYILNDCLSSNLNSLFISNSGLFEIDSNQISVNGNSNTCNGIEIQRFVLPKMGSLSNLSNNSITMSGKVGYGIFFNNIKNNQYYTTIIENNNVSLLTPHTSLGGINYTNCSSLKEKQSIVNSNNRLSTNVNQLPYGAFPIGIYYNGTEGEYTCNFINNIRNGVQFSLNCKNSEMSKFKFNNHFVGLLLDKTSTLKSDTSNGNTWIGNYSTGFAIQNSQNPLQTNFSVRSNAPVKFIPILQSPNSYIIKYTKSGIEDDNCGTSKNPNSGAFNIKDLILTNNLSFEDYNNELVYQNQKQLYYEIKPNENEFVDESLEKKFITFVESTNIDEFIEIEKLTNNLFESSINDDSQLENLKTTINNYDLKIRQLNNLNYIKDNDEKSTTNVQLNQIKENLETTFNKYNDILIRENIKIKNNIELILNKNQEIQTNVLSELMQKQFNNVYLNYIARGNLKLKEDEIIIIKNLAEKCSILNPDVVFRSRSFMKLYDDTTFYDDYLLCFQNENYEKSVKSSLQKMYFNNEIALYPNPANATTKLFASGIQNGKYTVSMSNILGQVVYSQEVDIKNNLLDHNINVKSIAAGEYLINLVNDNQSIVRKLIVTK